MRSLHHTLSNRLFTQKFLFLLLFVLVTGFTVTAWAAVPYIAFEAEAGTNLTNAAVVSDAAAAGGQALLFSSPGGSSPADFCSTFPALPSSKPTAANTGVPAGITLTNSGSITVTTAGTVIDAKNITGTIDVQANNVTIKNTRLKSTGYFAVRIFDGFIGTKVLNSEIYTDNGGYIGILGDNVTACGNYFHGFENSLTVGSNSIVQANFIEKTFNEATSHNDGMEIYSGSNIKVWGNNILMTDKNGNWQGETGAINVTTEYSNIDNVEINGNWMGGGSYTLYIRRSSASNAYRYSNIKVTNNIWYGAPPKGFAAYGPVSHDGGITTWTDNKWENGVAIGG